MNRSNKPFSKKFTRNRFQQQPKRDMGPNRNHMIKAREVQLISDEGENMGVTKLEDAIRMANEKEMDLVEIGPNVTPPVCKIMNYSKYLYEQKKKHRKNTSSKAKPMKEFRFSPVIDEHDFETKFRRGKEYLAKGHQVRMYVERRGRQPKEQALEVMNTILTKMADYSSIEPEPKQEGRKIFITYKPDGKAKN